MAALKERAEKEQLAYNVEMKELNRILDHDKKLKEFMTIKAQERANLLREAEENERRQKGRNRKFLAGKTSALDKV